MTTYRVEYIGWRDSNALFTTHPEAKGRVTYLFKVTSDDETRFLRVGIAALIPKQPGWVSLKETDHVKVAAKAVEYFLAGTVPKDNLLEDETITIKLTKDWYPGHPRSPELREDYQAFEVKVEKPKPPLGFIKD